MPKTISVDWKSCAIALNRKLNNIGARLKDLEQNSKSFDVSFCARELLDEFQLHTDQRSVLPDSELLLKSFDEIKALISRYPFVSVPNREELWQRIASLSADFSMNLAIHFSFIPAEFEGER